MLLGTLGASLLGKILAGKRLVVKSVSEERRSKSQGRGKNRAGEGVIRTDYGNKKGQKKKKQQQHKGFLMPPHPLTNFEIQKYQNEPSLMVFILEIIYPK